MSKLSALPTALVLIAAIGSSASAQENLRRQCCKELGGVYKERTGKRSGQMHCAGIGKKTGRLVQCVLKKQSGKK
jgi:hypothetical protein